MMINPFDNQVNKPAGDDNQLFNNNSSHDELYPVDYSLDIFSSSDSCEDSYFNQMIAAKQYHRITGFQQSTLRLMILIFILSMSLVGVAVYHAKNIFEQSIPSVQSLFTGLLMR